MKKFKRIPRIIATALSLLVAVGIGTSTPASAATTANKYAYSVGVDHGFVWPWSSDSSSINSRTSDGKGWLQKYNDALANGYTISRCLTYANSFYSSSNLGTYAKIYGSSLNTVASSSKSSSNELTNVTTNIPLSRLNNVVDSEIMIESKQIELILSKIKNIDSSFEANDYKMTINMFAPQDGNGMITFSYYIGENIKTNKAYIAVIENNTVVEIIANNVVTDMLNSKIPVNINVEAMENAVIQHQKNNDIESKACSVQNITSINNNYYFDFITNELRYEGTVFYENVAADNVIMDITTTTVLKY